MNYGSCLNEYPIVMIYISFAISHICGLNYTLKKKAQITNCTL